MRSLFTDTLVEARPECAVTFIDNHDTEPGQALESYIPEWFKPIAYFTGITTELRVRMNRRFSI